MNEIHLSQQEIERYIDGTLPYRQRAEMALHMYDCAVCRERFNILAPDFQERERASFLTADEDLSEHHNHHVFLAWAPHLWNRLPKKPLQLTFASLILLTAVTSGFLWWKANPDQQLSVTSVNNQMGVDNGVSAPVIASNTSNNKPLAVTSTIDSQNVRQQAKDNLKKLKIREALVRPAQNPVAQSRRLLSGHAANPIIGKLAELTAAPSSTFEANVASLPKSPPEILLALRPAQNQIARGTIQPETSTDNIKLINPVGEVILAEKPTFRWQAIPYAVNYQVTVYDSQFNQIAQQSVSKALCQFARPLTHDQFYLWKVTAFRDSKVIASSVSATFKTSSLKQQRMLNKLRKGKSDLRTAVYLAQNGMLSEASNSLEYLLSLNPQNQRAKQMLETIKNWNTPSPEPRQR